LILAGRDTGNRRQRLEEEIREIEPGSGHRLKVVLVFPAPYSVGMANLGYQLVYRLFNSIPGVCCHRAFASAAALSDRMTPVLKPPVVLESGEPLTTYDVIAFSLNYENDLLNVPRMLRAAGLHPLQSRRGDRDPWVIAGGVSVTINPEPLADILDFCVLGEAEHLLPDVCDILSHLRGMPKHAVLQDLAGIPGVYIPQFYQPEYCSDGAFRSIRYIGSGPAPDLRRRIVPSLDAIPGSTVIHTPHTEFPKLHLVEISRGCPRNCRFCLIPGCYGPYRYRSLDSVLNAAEAVPAGWRVGLLGAGAADHPDLATICRELTHREIHFSFSSLHAGRITHDLADAIRDFGPRTVTLAPEAGSDRRRKTLGKTILNSELLEAVERVGRPPMKIIKVYFMIGLPGETEEDLLAITDLCRHMEDRLRYINRRSKTIPRIAVGISCFVPKAMSPFERAPQCAEKTLKQKLQFVIANLRKIRELRWTADVPRWSAMQGILARGDRRLSQWFIESAKPGADWRDGMRRSAVSGAFQPEQKIPLSAALP